MNTANSLITPSEKQSEIFTKALSFVLDYTDIRPEFDGYVPKSALAKMIEEFIGQQFAMPSSLVYSKSRLNISKAMSILKECDDYLNEEIWEWGKVYQLNSIGSGSILHNKIKMAIEGLQNE